MSRLGGEAVAAASVSGGTSFIALPALERRSGPSGPALVAAHTALARIALAHGEPQAAESWAKKASAEVAGRPAAGSGEAPRALLGQRPDPHDRQIGLGPVLVGSAECDGEAAQQQQAFDAYVKETAGTSGQNVADQLSKLADLKSQGVITDAEFEAQKSKLLASA